MVSRAVVITTTLLLATLIVAIVGYMLYKSYYDIYEGLNRPQNLTYVLNKVSRLTYTVSVNGRKTLIEVNINRTGGTGTIKVIDIQGNKSESYRFYFDPRTGIYRAEKEVSIGNSTGFVTLDVSSFTSDLEHGILIYPTASGSLNITVKPGLVPLISLYNIAKELNISWTERRGIASSVVWEPITYEFEGTKYKGVLVDITISAPPIVTSIWERATDIRAIVIHMDDLYVFPYVELLAGGVVISFNLTSITFSGH